MTHKQKWLTLAPAGLVLIGFGACLVSWSGGLMAAGAPTRKWFLAGTASLAVLNSGVALFGQSVLERALMDLEKQQRTR